MAEKEEVISRLYVLRAGLSLISQEKDKADTIMRNVNNRNAKLIAGAKKKIADAEKDIKSKKGKLSEAESSREENKKQARASGKYVGSFFAWLFVLLFVALALAFLLAFAYAIVLWCAGYADGKVGGIYGESWQDKEWLKNIIGWLVYDNGEFLGTRGDEHGFITMIAVTILSLPAAGLMFFIACRIGGVVSDNRYDRKRKNEAKREVINLEESISDRKTAVTIAERAYGEACTSLKIVEDEAEQNYNAAVEKAVVPVSAGLIMYEGLRNATADLVDERDWANTDLLIYYLETGRADTVKEGLQLVDRERQTERIVEAVQLAGREICRTMSTCINRLQNDMRRCFKILSDQMILQTEIFVNEVGGLKNEIGLLREGQNAQTRYIEQLTSSTAMNSALLAKANESSQTLSANVEQLRINSDYKAMRLRNGI